MGRRRCRHRGLRGRSRGCRAVCSHGDCRADDVSGAKFKEIVLHLLDQSNDVRIVRTICNATDQRQAAAVQLARQVDMMLVIGGKNSANTTRLAQLCSKECQTYHIETAAELQDEWFDKIKKIGITAGASTPDWIIKEVYQKCKNKT